MYNRNRKMKKKEDMEATDPKFSFGKIMKEVENFGSTYTTWKEKKALENKKVAALGGKAQKTPRRPLSVALVQMKKQKEREEKMFEQNQILGKFGGLVGGGSTKKPVEKKRKPEDRVLKSTVGDFKGGVLHVRHMLHSGSSKINDRDKKMPNYSKISLGGEGSTKSKGNKKKKGKKNKGKKKGGGKKKR